MSLGRALGVGAGMAGIGGLLSGYGQHQQAGAEAGALRRGLGDMRQLAGQIQDEGAFTQGRLGGLQDQFQGVQTGQAQDFAGQSALFRAMHGDAQGMLGDAGTDIQGMLRQRPTGPGTDTAAALAQERVGGRMQPHTDLQGYQLAQAMMGPEMLQQQLGHQSTMAGLGRQGQELGADSYLRQALLGGQQQLAMGGLSEAMAQAGTRGMMTRALGGTASGLAPGVTAAMIPSPRRPLQTEVEQ